MPDWALWLLGQVFASTVAVWGLFKLVVPKLVDARIEDQKREDEIRIRQLEANIELQRKNFEAQVAQQQREFEAKQQSEARQDEFEIKKQEALIAIIREALSWLHDDSTKIDERLVAIEKEVQRNGNVISAIVINISVLTEDVRKIAKEACKKNDE
jgi:hypothetical protein